MAISRAIDDGYLPFAVFGPVIEQHVIPTGRIPTRWPGRIRNRTKRTRTHSNPNAIDGLVIYIPNLTPNLGDRFVNLSKNIMDHIRIRW